MKKKINWLVVIFALVGIGGVILSIFVQWYFLVITLIAFLINQRELLHK